MRPRRTLIALTAVLLVATLAASVLQAPGRRGDAGPGAAERPEAGSPGAAPAGPRADGASTAGPVRVRFDAGRAAPVVIELHRGAHAIVTVAVPGSGEVRLEGLDLVANADSLTPAVFDFLATRPGRFAVTFTPAGEPRRRAGTLVVSG